MKADRTRVIYVIAAPVVGGAERQLLELLRRLDRTRLVPEVIAFEGGPWEDRFAALAPPLTVVPCRPRLRALRDLVVLLRKKRPDIVHTFGRSATYLGCAAAKVAGVKTIIASERSAPVMRPTWMLALEAGLFRTIDRVVTNSAHAAQFYRTWRIVPDHRLSTIVTGVDTHVFNTRTRTPAGEPTFGCLGDLKFEKDHAALLRAVGNLSRSLPFRVSIAGDGPLRSALAHEIRVLGLDGRVRLEGVVEPAAWLPTIDAYVHCAKYEGMPNALLEAMATGLPCIAVECDATREVIKHGENGLLVPRGDVLELARAMERVIAAPALGHRLGNAARHCILSRFSASRMARETAELYDAELARIAPPSSAAARAPVVG